MPRKSVVSATVVPTASEEQAKNSESQSADAPVNVDSSKEQSNVPSDVTTDIQAPVNVVSSDQTAIHISASFDSKPQQQPHPDKPVLITPLSIGHSIHSNLNSSAAQKASGFKLTKNYRALVASFKHMQPFSRSTDGKYPAKTICVLCTTVKPTSVLFPCQHMCVCNKCITSNDMSPDYSFSLERCICPVCRTEIRLILPHTGDEEDKYWNWVLATKPQLPSEFKKSFKSAGKKLSEDSVAETRSSTVDSLTLTSTSKPSQHPGRLYRGSSWTATIVKRGSAYKLDASKKQESCLIL